MQHDIALRLARREERIWSPLDPLCPQTLPPQGVVVVATTQHMDDDPSADDGADDDTLSELSDDSGGDSDGSSSSSDDDISIEHNAASRSVSESLVLCLVTGTKEGLHNTLLRWTQSPCRGVVGHVRASGPMSTPRHSARTARSMAKQVSRCVCHCGAGDPTCDSRAASTHSHLWVQMLLIKRAISKLVEARLVAQDAVRHVNITTGLLSHQGCRVRP